MARLTKGTSPKTYARANEVMCWRERFHRMGRLGWGVSQDGAISEDAAILPDGTLHRMQRFNRMGRCTGSGDFTGWDVAQNGAISQDGT